MFSDSGGFLDSIENAVYVDFEEEDQPVKVSSPEARRRLEAYLAERALEKDLREFDFDLRS